MASKTRKTGTVSGSEQEAELGAVALPDAPDLPESLTIDVTLPEQVHSTPDDELAVALSDATVRAEHVLSNAKPTTSINLVPVMPEPKQPADALEDHGLRSRKRHNSAVDPETAAMLTADRLLGSGTQSGSRPEGLWPAFVYASTLRKVNLGDSSRVRARKELEARIGKRLDGGTRFVPILTRKGGVGKTTVATLLGMALADVREDRVIAIDANPDRGTLAERVNKQTSATVRDVVANAATINTFSELSSLLSRDETRLDTLASNTDPLLSEAIDEEDYNKVVDVVSRFYSIVLTDCGTGIVHSVMRATLQRADSVVIVSGGSVDEARLASETLTWLEANGYSSLAHNAVVALNTGTRGTNVVNVDEIEAHFRSRVREVVLIPYDPLLASGAVVSYQNLEPLTRATARNLAAFVVDGLSEIKGD